MTTRINFIHTLETPIGLLTQIEEQITASGVPSRLVHLIKMRASQINGCAFCLHMHTRAAIGDGEAVERLTLLPAFRESSLYTEEERATLAWTETVTRLGDDAASEADYAALRACFDEHMAAQITLAVAMINLWNRLAVALRAAHPKLPLTTAGAPHAA